MDASFARAAEQAATFQKMWLEAVSKWTQAAFSPSPNSTPPDLMRQARSAMFQAWADAWEEFMRSPQFLESSRQLMEGATTFRKLSADFMARARNEMQAPSRDDIDTVMLSVRHLESRLLGRIDELAEQVQALSQQVEASRGRRGTSPANGKTPAKARTPRKSPTP